MELNDKGLLSKVHKRLRGFEAIDEVRLVVVPRFKESGLSGDEWRQCCAAELYHKGVLVGNMRNSTMAGLALDLANRLAGNTSAGCIGGSEDAADVIIDLEKSRCDQPSCSKIATNEFFLKEEFSDVGEGPLPTREARVYRKFCNAHEVRGTGSREDSDSNYSRE